MENFDDIKVGDKVVVCSHWSRRIAEVTKVTPKRFMIGATQYEKKNGRKFGRMTNREVNYCLHVTDAILNEFEQQNLFIAMRRAIREIISSNLTYEQTEQLYNFMLELTGQKKDITN